MQNGFELDLLGHFCQNSELISKYIDSVNENYFSQKHTKILFKCISDLWSKDRELTPFIIEVEYCKYTYEDSNKIYEFVERNLFDTEPGNNIEDTLDFLHDSYLESEIKGFSGHLNQLIQNRIDVNQVAKQTEQFLNKITQGVAESKNVDILGEDEVIYTGNKFLDNSLNGFMRAQFTAILALPGHGKSTFLVWLAKMFLKQGLKVCFFSLEMTRRQVYQKLISNVAQVDSRKIIHKNMDQAELNRAVKVQRDINEKLSETFFVYGNGECTSAPEIKREMRKIKPDVVLIDSFQEIEMPSSGGGALSAAMGTPIVIRDLKNMAAQINAAVIVSAWANEERDKKTGRIIRPKIGSFYASKALQKFSSDIYALFYFYGVLEKHGGISNTHYDYIKNVMEIIPRKARFAEIGKLTMLGFKPEIGEFDRSELGEGGKRSYIQTAGGA